MNPATAAPDAPTAYIDPPTAATLSRADNAAREVKIARIPIGAQMQMLGGMFTVTNADRHRLTVRGPLGKLTRGKIIDIFGVAAQVTMIGKHVATITARRGVFDYRPIYRLEEDKSGPPTAVAIHPDKLAQLEAEGKIQTVPHPSGAGLIKMYEGLQVVIDDALPEIPQTEAP